MTKLQSIQLFEESNVRTIWDEEHEKWYFSVVDVVQVLTVSDYQAARKYWKVLKGRIVQEAAQPVTIVTSSKCVLQMARCVSPMSLIKNSCSASSNQCPHLRPNLLSSGWHRWPPGTATITVTAGDCTATCVVIVEAVETDIESSEIKIQKSEIIYDLQGRRILNTENLKSGIYIIDGKLVVVK